MLDQNQNDKTIFSGKLRVRVCGLLEKDGKILLLKHQSIGPAGYLWSPPGGGVEFGESMHEALEKEFLEETNLSIKIDRYLFINEFISSEHHAIEVFFKVNYISGELILGSDPELSPENQILTEAKFFGLEELEKIPENAIHNAFNATDKRDQIMDVDGLLTFRH